MQCAMEYLMISVEVRRIRFFPAPTFEVNFIEQDMKRVVLAEWPRFTDTVTDQGVM